MRSGPCCWMAWIFRNPSTPTNATAITASVVDPIMRLLFAIARLYGQSRSGGSPMPGQAGLKASVLPRTFPHWHTHDGDIPAGKAGSRNFIIVAVVVADPHAVFPMPADRGTRRIPVVGNGMRR